MELLATDHERLPEAVDQAPRQQAWLVRAAHVGLQDHELVAAQPANRVGLAQAGMQALGGRLEQQITARQAEGVVDALEPIQIEQQHRHHPAAPARARQRLVEIIPEQRPVGQAGERIMAGLMTHLGLGPFLLGDVQGHGHDIGDPAGVVEQRRFGGQQDVLLGGDRAGHLLLEARQGLAGLEHLGIEHELPGRVLLAVNLLQGAADRARRVDAVDLPVGAVDQGHPAAAVDRADGRRHRVDQAPQAQLAGAQRRLVLLAARHELPAELEGALLEELLLLAQGQQIARPGAELDVIDRAQQEIGRPGLERLVAVAPILVDRDHHDRDVTCPRQGPKGPDEVGAIHPGHLVVGDHQIRKLAQSRIEGRLRAGECFDPDPLLDRGRQSGKYVPIGHPIVDDDNIGHRKSVLDDGCTRLPGQGTEPLSLPLAERRLFIKQKVKSRTYINTLSYLRQGHFAARASVPPAPARFGHQSNPWVSRPGL